MKFNTALFFHPEEISSLRVFAETWPGRVLMTVIMLSSSLYIYGPHDICKIVIILLAALAAYVRGYRLYFTLLATLVWSLRVLPASFGHHFINHHLLPVIAFFGGGALILVLARKVGRRGVFAYPVFSLFAILTILIVCSQWSVFPHAVRSIFWRAAIILSVAKWFLAYAINNITSRRPKPGTLLENLSVLYPFWGSSQTPYGKGWSYIGRQEARNDDQLAKTQLKAVRLFITIIIINIVNIIYLRLTAHIESPFSYMLMMVHGGAPNRGIAAVSLVTQFFETLFSMYIYGNAAVAIARFAGFDIQQNTINPLCAHSIADFWNRWYFYFKELLVDFFFIPTSRRMAWLPEKIRVFLATLMAAGVGNYIYHVYRDFEIIGSLGVLTYLKSTGIYAIYCLSLGVGIGISQAINPNLAANASKKGFRLHVCLGVIAFFCIVGLLGAEEPSEVFAQHMQVGLIDYLKFYAYICHLV